MSALLFTTIFLILPAVLLWLIERNVWAKKLGPIILCYGLGLVISNFGLVSDSMQIVQINLSQISVALALPMLFFTLDIRQWIHRAGKAFISMVCASTAVMAVVSSLFFLNQHGDPVQTSHLAAMSVGVYTGGTPNLAAIKSALNISNELYILFHSLDTVVGAVYLLFMVSIAVPIFRKILPSFTLNHDTKHFSKVIQDIEFYDENYQPLVDMSNLKQLLKIFFLALLIVLISLAGAELGQRVMKIESSDALSILLISSFSVMASLSSGVRSLTLSYKLGMYLILVFCVVVASMANLQTLLEIDEKVVVFLIGTVTASLVLHAALCRLFKVDSDTFMVTSVSAICSPPFVPMMVKALDNPNVLLSGMTTGIVGLIIGNYLGVSLALILQTFL